MNLDQRSDRTIYQASNQRQNKIANQQMILRILRHQTMSRADLARASGLTRAAITGLVEQLLGRGLLRETKAVAVKTGRRPTLLSINPDFAWILALILSRKTHHIGLADFTGRIVSRLELPDLGPANLTSIVPQAIGELLRHSGDPERPVSGLGITAPGPLSRTQGKIIDPPDFKQWHQVSVVDLLQTYIKEPIYLENNAAAAAMAEYFQGEAAACRHFLVLTVDSGIGGGLYIDGQPYQGAGGFGQEIGHMTIDWQGRSCACGHRGCLERYASVPEILAEGERLWRQWQIQESGESTDQACTTPAGAAGAPRNWQELIDRVLAGDRLAGRLLDLESDYLTAGILNLRNFLELNTVIISGELVYKPEPLLARLRPRLRKQAMTRRSQDMVIDVSQLEQADGLTAAAALVLQHQHNDQAFFT